MINCLEDSAKTNRRKEKRHTPKRGVFYSVLSRCRVGLLLLVLSSFQPNDQTLAQSITLQKNNLTVDELFRDIHRQTGYDFIYDSDLFPPQKRFQVKVVNASLKEVLDRCLAGLPVTYTITGKTIMLQEAAGKAAPQKTIAAARQIRGKVTDAEGKPLSYASIQVAQTGLTYVSRNDGGFEVTAPDNAGELTVTASYVGKASVTKTISEKQFGNVLLFVLNDLSLKMAQVEVNGVRKKTLTSNSSIVFDRESIEQTQSLSVGDVLKYLPGQAMQRPGASLQGANVLTLRNVTPPNTDQSLNNAFGISMQIDGNPVNNNANMQAMNPGLNGFISSHNITTPNTIGDPEVKNGSFSNVYAGDVANSGVDLRQLQAENIESIEVVSGVASARYGDYNTGVVIVNRQAGVTPLRVSLRTNEGTQNVGINKGFSVSPSLGVMNLSFDYLNSNEDPRNKLKSFGRIGGGLLWTVHQKGALQFKNTLSADYNSTLDKTRQDPDDGYDRMAKFSGWNLRVSNRSELIVKKPWLYNIQLQASFDRGRQESYSQYYMNLQPVIGITNSEVSGTFEGYFAPGYYLAVQQVIGEPVNANARLETNSYFHIKKVSYKLTVGGNYSYNANKGPGTIMFPDRPRFHQTGNKNDRARSFNNVPTQENFGVYVENFFTTRLLDRLYTLNVGARGDVQNGFFNVSPRVNSNWKVHKNLSWSLSYGIATKAPSLLQVSPGNVYIDIPLVNAYTGNADQSVYLVHTEVIRMQNKDLKPYRSRTMETGLVLEAKPFHISAYYFDRLMDNGFTTARQLLPVVLPNYTVTPVSGGKPQYEPDGTYKTYNVTYNRINNGNYNRTRGVEMILATDKLPSIATSFNLGVALYRSRLMEKNEEVSVPSGTIDYTRPAVYGVYRNQESKGTNIKSTLTTNTHIPSLRLAVMLTGEVYWMNRTEDLATSIYPVGYLNKDLVYTPLPEKEAASPEYAHLLQSPRAEQVKDLPSFVYPNIHLRLSKEIGDYLRFSFNAFNAFNIRPMQNRYSQLYYYNGRPSFGAELLFTIK